MKKLFVATALLLLVFNLFAGCDTPKGSAPDSLTVADNSPSAIESTALNLSQSDFWNLDYATVKYDSSGRQSWVARYNGPANAFDEAQAIAVDESGNTYVTGASMGSGNGTQSDYVTVKYDKNGQQTWAARYSSPGYGGSVPEAISVDSLGNVYVTGNSAGTNNGSEYATVKYDSSGRQIWVARYSGPGNSGGAYALAVDGSGNVYVTGFSRGSNSADDFATIKYDSNGHQLWVSRYANGSPFALTLDKQGNVYVTGFTRINGGDYATVKYDNNGKQLWAAIYNGHGNSNDVAYGLAVDGTGNVYITGRSTGVSGIGYDYATVKYNSDGAQLWVARYHGVVSSDDTANNLAIDSAGNVYVTGQSGRANGNRDMTTIKYDTNGATLWVARYSSSENSDNIGWDLAVDLSGNVYVAGQSGVAGATWNYAVVKYDGNGKQAWAVQYHGPGVGIDEARAVAVDKNGNVYVTGQSTGNAGVVQMTQAPWSGVKICTATTQTIKVKIGEEFAFGFDTFAAGGLSWNEQHDDSMVSMEDKEEVSVKPEYPSNQNTWFLFKALKAGNTQITFTYSMGGGLSLNDQRVVNIEIK